MGTVYRAREIQTGRTVALKVLHSGGAESNVQRFAREARVLAELSHPGIVRYIAHGVTQEGEPYLAMEWLEGETLDVRLARGGLAIDAAVALATRVAEALGVAHARGVVHRDIKPQNLFLVNSDVHGVKLVDFGIVRRRAESQPVTRTDMFVGTPAYAAPEQARGVKDVDARADVFSLGCVLFECLTGRPPFLGDHVMAILAKILFEEPPRVSDLNTAVPSALSDLVARMLSKEPAERPADGVRLAEELSLLGDAIPGTASAATAAPTLTAGEQRLISVILMGSGTEGENEAALTLTPDEVAAPFERLRALVAPLAARVECLPNGSAIAALSGKGSASDLAVQAARCALAMRAVLPNVPMVLTTGRSVFEGRLLVGEAIDRAVDLLRMQAETWTSSARHTGRPIRVDDVTAALLELRFDIGGAPDAPELLGERDANEGARTLLGQPTPCVGRERELAVLDGFWSECVTEPVARTVLVTGEAGIGKSRLRYEFLRSARQKARAAGGVLPQIWIAQGDPNYADSSFGLIGQLLRRFARLVQGEPLEARRKALKAQVAAYVGRANAARVAEFLGELVGTPFSDQGNVQLRVARRDPILMSTQTKQAWVDFMSAACDAHPILIVLEDLHWGDLPSVHLIEAALQSLPERPLMVLALARPQVHDLFPKLWSECEPQEIRLGKLSRKASERLARQVLGEGISEERMARLVGQAAGNALYLEELIRAVAEGKGDGLPETVLAMMQSRLEALEPLARQIVRAGSVFGEVFWARAVASLLGSGRDSGPIDEWLEELSDREILARRGNSRFPGEREYAFRHALVCAAAYGTLTERDRALGHRLAGAWLEGIGEQDTLALAEHFERGGERARAAVFYQRAEEQALEANDFRAVIARAEQAVSCGAEGEVLGAVRQLEAEARLWRDELGVSEALGLEALELLPRGSPRWLKALDTVAVVSFNRGNHDRLSKMAEDLRDLVPPPSAMGLDIIVMAQVARLLVRSGMLDVAEPLFQRLAAAMEDMAHDPAVVGYVQAAFASRSLFKGDTAFALVTFEASYRSFDLAGDARNRIVRRMSAAMALMDLGGHARAEVALRQMLAESNRIGVIFLATVVKCRLALVLTIRGTLDEARALAEEVSVKLTTGGNRWYASIARRNLALTLLGMGHLDLAEGEAEKSVDLSAIPSVRCPALAVLAEVRLRRGRAAEALSAAAEASELLDMLGGLEESESLVRLVIAEALHVSGDLQAARKAAAQARARLLARAARIEDAELRRSFLEQVPENARTLELATRLEAP
jgi:tetratricopeptide (TPR) repeat protein